MSVRLILWSVTLPKVLQVLGLSIFILSTRLLYIAALRASLGHSSPFTLKFVEIGNEVLCCYI